MFIFCHRALFMRTATSPKLHPFHCSICSLLRHWLPPGKIPGGMERLCQFGSTICSSRGHSFPPGKIPGGIEIVFLGERDSLPIPSPVHLPRACGNLFSGMALTVHSLASGSSGNFILVRDDNSALLIDAGIGIRRSVPALQQAGVDRLIFREYSSPRALGSHHPGRFGWRRMPCASDCQRADSG